MVSRYNNNCKHLFSEQEINDTFHRLQNTFPVLESEFTDLSDHNNPGLDEVYDPETGCTDWIDNQAQQFRRTGGESGRRGALEFLCQTSHGMHLLKDVQEQSFREGYNAQENGGF